MSEKNNKKFVPRKGGDGGAPVKVRRGPNWSANARVVLTGASISCKSDREAFTLVLVETTDGCDRAHNEKKLIHDKAPEHRDESFVLKLLGEIDIPGSPPVSTPRRYHPSQIVGRVELDDQGIIVFDNRVGLDSMFDHAAAVAARYERAGIVLGWGTSFPRERSTRVESERVQMMAAHFAGMSRDEVRNRINQRTSMGLTKEEARLQHEGTRMLRADMVDWDGMDE